MSKPLDPDLRALNMAIKAIELSTPRARRMLIEHLIKWLKRDDRLALLNYLRGTLR